MFGPLEYLEFSEYLESTSVYTAKRNKEKVERQLKAWQIPEALWVYSANPDTLNMLSPYMEMYQQGTQRLGNTIRQAAGHFAPVGGELPSLPNPQTTSVEDRRRLAVQSKVDVS